MSINPASSLKANIPFLAVLVLTFFAILLRILYIQNTHIIKPIRADASDYVAYGYNLFSKGVYSKDLSTDNPVPDSFRSPGYPLFLALTLAIGGEDGFYLLALHIQALLSALLVPLTYIAGQRFVPFLPAFISAVLVAVSPHLVSLSSYLLSETLFSLWLLSALIVAAVAVKNNRLIIYAVAGLLFGFAYLTNETVLFIPFVLAAYFFWRFKGVKNKNFLIRMLVFLAVFTLFPTGWALRNHLNVPPDAPKGSDRALITLTHGTYLGFIYERPEYKYKPYLEDPLQPEFASSIQNFLHIFFDRFKKRPLRYLSWYLLEKPYYLWSWSILAGQGGIYIYPVRTSLYHISTTANISRAMMKWTHLAFVIAAFLGIVSFFLRTGRFQKKSGYTLMLIPLLYYTLFYIPFVPWPRYALPLRPELYLCAVAFICAVYETVMKKIKQTDKKQ